MGQCIIGEPLPTQYRGRVRTDLTADEKHQWPSFTPGMQKIAEAGKLLDLKEDGATISDVRHRYMWLREGFSELKMVGEPHEEEEL